MKRVFTHEFEDCSVKGSLSVETDAITPAQIRMIVDREGGFWLTANREGWLHLARICAELGLGDYENGYHFHEDADFQWSTGPPEFTFGRDDAVQPVSAPARKEKN